LEKKYAFVPAGIRNPDHPACNLVTVLATVFRFIISWLYGWLLLDNEKGTGSKTNKQTKSFCCTRTLNSYQNKHLMYTPEGKRCPYDDVPIGTVLAVVDRDRNGGREIKANTTFHCGPG
jgi:hypothetical protein